MAVLLVSIIALCREFLDQLIDGTILAILVRRGESKIAKQSWSSCRAFPTCPPTSLLFGDQDCKIARQSCPPGNPGLKGKLVSETKIARLLGNLAQTIVLIPRHTVSLVILANTTTI